MKLTAEHVSSVRGSTTTDAHEVADFLARKMTAQAGRASAMAARNKARSALYRATLDAAVVQVLGNMPLKVGHGVPRKVLQLICKGVREGKLPPTLAYPNDPSMWDIRQSLYRLTNVATPELARNPEPFTSTYPSAQLTRSSPDE